MPVYDGSGVLRETIPVTPVDADGGALDVEVQNWPASQPVSIAPGVWTDIYAAYAVGDGTGDHTMIAAPAANHALEFAELTVICGETAANTVLVKNGSTTFARADFTTVMDSLSMAYQYPDYKRLGTAAALVVNNSAAKIFTVFGRYRTVAV